MYRKILLYAKCVILNGVKNPLRFVLSISGIFVGITLLSYAVFFLDAYYNGSMEEVEKMPENAFLVSDLDIDGMQDLKENPDLYSYPKEFCYTDSTTWLLDSSKYEGKHFHFYSTVIGTPAQEKTSIYIGGEGAHLTKLSLLEGRFIANGDVSNKNRVAVIDSCIAELLYPNESAIGKSLLLYGDEIIYTYEIIGVSEANYETKNRIAYVKSQLASNEEAFFINSSIYIPYSVWQEEFAAFGGDSLLLWTELDQAEKKRCENAIRNYFNTDYHENITNKITEEKNIMDQLSIYKSLFIIFFLVVFIFSGLNCMNIIFFSVKERISEIGIRKAYGASKESIVMQFILEALMISFIATFFAILAALILMIKSGPLLESYLGINLVVKLKPELFLLPLLVAGFQGILFSIIPSMYASSIKVVDALRFE